jgi:hypothetical protein
VPTLAISPVYGLIGIGDIITHINNGPLGDRKGQVSPSLLMWRIKPGDNIIIRFKKQIENFSINHQITTCTQEYPAFLDFPWYTVTSPELNNMMTTII